jgi:hypothetical protein
MGARELEAAVRGARARLQRDAERTARQEEQAHAEARRLAQLQR